MCWRQFGWNHWPAKKFSWLLYFEIRFCDPYLRRWAVLYSSQTSLFSTVVLSVWSFLRSFAVIRAVSAGKLTGKLALMPECGPPWSWKGRPECECWGKAVRRSVISSDAIFRLYRDRGRTSWFCCWETTTLGVTQAQRKCQPLDRLKPVLNWANVCSPEHTSDTSTNYDSFLNWTFSSPNMVRTVQTLLHSQLACNEMQASARTCGRRAADSMMEM